MCGGCLDVYLGGFVMRCVLVCGRRCFCAGLVFVGVNVLWRLYEKTLCKKGREVL